MNQNKLFFRTRWRLAGLYAGVMGLILGLSELCLYQVMVHADWQALHRELGSVAGTLHDGLEPKLNQPGRIDPEVKQLLPGLCLGSVACQKPSEPSERHILGAVQQTGYYARFLDQSGRLIATVGQAPDGLPFQGGAELWQTLQDRNGERYHQISLLLKTNQQTPWGYMQVGRSLAEFERHVSNTQLALVLGFPAAMLLVSGASWWLAGLAMRPVYRSYQQMQQFTADAAHELRTPLAATRATVEDALDMDELPESEARSTLQTIQRQNYRLSQLVQDLLLLSRVDSQKLTLKYQPCCLNDLISDVIEEFEGLAIGSEIQLSTDIRVQQPLLVTGDEEQLYRLLTNLVINAIQYTPKGGNVTVALDRSEHHALIHVQDTGIGIASKDQPRIFDRFYRVNSDRSRQTGGAGLGLAIAKAIVLAHKGSLDVQSELCKGSIFTVLLPLKISSRSR